MNLQSKNNKSNLRTGLYIVSTPIGNMADISFRAVNILKNSDLILCEDTRVSKKLISKYDINSNLVSYHKFNEKKNIEKILIELKKNKIISIISDAGTPTISDPGKILVNACINESINIFPIPGSSAVAASFSVSGFSEKYYFYGFFPQKNKELNNDLAFLSNLNSSIIFFISSKKINKAIPQIKKFFSGRKILICREMTKFYEEYIRSNVDDIKIFEKIPKGELTLVLSEKYSEKNFINKLNESDKKNIKKMLKTLSIKDITQLISQNKNISKKEIYNYCLKLKNEK